MPSLAPEQDPKIWNLVAGKYAEHLDPMTGAYAPDVIRLADIKPHDRVLDVACGAGAVAIPAARTGADVLATDISSEFVDLVSQRAREQGLVNLKAQEMDGQALDLSDDAFDRVVSNFGVFLFPEREKGFREIHRVLKPGGKAVMTSFVAPPDNEWMEFFGTSMKRAFPGTPPPPPPKFLELADPERFRRELEEAGFSDVQIETNHHRTSWPTVDQAWSALAESAPVFHAIMQKVGDEGVDRLRKAFDALAQERFGPAAPFMIGSPAHYAVARKG